MFVLGLNKGLLSTGNNVHILTDSRGKTYLGFLLRENSQLYVRYLKKSDFGTPTGNTYTNVSFFGYTVSIDPAILNALTGTDEPEGVALTWQVGLVSQYLTGITNLNYVPKTNSAIDSITLASINADSGNVNPQNPNAVKKAFTVVANPNGTVTAKDIQIGDLVAIDGGTAVAATEVTYTSGTLKDGPHSVVVTAKGSTYYYDPATVSATTKIALLSAPVSFIKENPLLSGAILLGIILLIAYVFVPLSKGEPIFNGMLEGGNNGKNAKIVKLKSNRKRMSLAA
jgi:hypothetical protein